ncbi:hypothetical protein ANCCAN_06431 [Ancylostoma caninum]|uniref:Uncharacterized protein n=1 Tax=Ancylostoma caninum TaxID=29170 RepID=A0A368GW10_ANCCA|nr:hypothetical protein ANCCAN_06431 [Ancylostoma caninum]
MVQLKRDSPAPVSFAAEVKKFKSDFEAELAEINAKFDSPSSVHCKAVSSENPTPQPCGTIE